MYIKDINKAFTDKVVEYLNKGWIINLQSEHSLGNREIGKCDITDGKTILRVMLTENPYYDRKDREDLYGVNILTLGVYRETKGNKPFSSIVFDKWECIWARQFYSMPHTDKWYTESPAEAQEAVKTWRERHDFLRNYRTMSKAQDTMYGLMWGRFEYPEEVKRNLLPLVRRLPRCKTAHLEDIGRVYRDIRNPHDSRIRQRAYFIEVKGNTHTICT